MPAVLGYWDVRGRAQSIRLLLEFTGTEYTEKLYHVGPAPTYDRTEWLSDKFSLGMKLPNLPYYFDGPHKITQSNAILRYIARKHGLCGQTEEEIQKVDMLENLASDLRTDYIRLIYMDISNFEKNKDVYTKVTLPASLKQLNDYLGNNKWFAGNNITFPDFLFYGALDLSRILDPGSLDNFKSLRDYVERFESLDAIKKYMNSPRFIKSPLNGPMAAFGGNKTD